MDRRQAPIGVFITLEEPTAPMINEALSTGFYRAHGKRYPKLQILTVEDLLAGKKAEMPLPISFKAAVSVDKNKVKQLKGQGKLF